MKKNATNKQEANDIPSEVAFRRGERGKYAYRFGEVTADETMAADLLRSKGIEVESIDRDRFAKTPDFRLLKGDRPVAYCEVKTFERDVWLDRMLAEVPGGTLAGGVRPDPIYNRIANAIHTAGKQLEAANPGHEMLNVLILMNHDPRALYKDLVSVITGEWDPLGGIGDKTYSQFSEGRIANIKRQIDLYAWLEVNQNTVKERGYFFGSYKTRLRVCSLFEIKEELIRTVA